MAQCMLSVFGYGVHIHISPDSALLNCGISYFTVEYVPGLCLPLEKPTLSCEYIALSLLLILSLSSVFLNKILH